MNQCNATVMEESESARPEPGLPGEVLHGGGRLRYPGGSEALASTSIQAGIVAAASGDTVLVSPGTYFETVNFLGRNIVVTRIMTTIRGLVS